MSINEANKAVELFHKSLKKKNYIQFGTIRDDVIHEAEKILTLDFPKTYKIFLRNFGFVGGDGFVVYGLRTNKIEELKDGGIVWATLLDRQDGTVPNHIICISEIGDGSYYALDVSQMDAEGECPVVVWPLDGYDATPKLEIVAKDFGTFFLSLIEEKIKDQHKSTEA